MTNIQKNCAACGKPITVRLADHKRGWGKFCGKACAAGYKCGMRPRDVNKRHAKQSAWASEALAARDAAGVNEWPKAPSVKEQLGHRVKVRPIYHSPSECRECGKRVNGPGLCWECEAENEANDAMEAGWDGHKTGGAHA
ncbi:hypothetical protein GR138_12925 [Shinella kummerowiae]|uniref:Uncharacterized protein n=1 Tax=Shinella kummerowiae TaxID=417745 RepID=A0A6N8SAK3_9HYPH|nr:hypothetical protein [Shinella kummerowiae]MXN46094.1 hypothetical protein [Shinella kummerowiae]